MAGGGFALGLAVAGTLAHIGRMTHICAWPHCTLEGSFPAPKDPRDLRLKQYFCKEHIREFNKRWNGLEGFHPDEIFRMQNTGPSWDKPTWNLGLNDARGEPRTSPFASADDLFEFFQQRVAREGKHAAPALELPADVKEAMVILNVQPPLEQLVLKKQYLGLVKQHHPDVNKSAGAEEHIKKINVAYKILTAYVM